MRSTKKFFELAFYFLLFVIFLLQTNNLILKESKECDNNILTKNSFAKIDPHKSGFNQYWLLVNYLTGDYVDSVSISSDGYYIAVGGSDNKVYLFNRSSSIPMWSYSTGRDMGSVSISSDGSYIVAGGVDGMIYLFNRSSSTPMWSYSTISDVYSVSISSDGCYLADGSMDGMIYLFNRSSSTPM